MSAREGDGDAGVDRRWWIGEGTERCPFCLQGYAMEVEMRCVACDEPGCMHCVATVRVAEGPGIFCPTCAPGEGR